MYLGAWREHQLEEISSHVTSTDITDIISSKMYVAFKHLCITRIVNVKIRSQAVHIRQHVMYGLSLILANLWLNYTSIPT